METIEAAPESAGYPLRKPLQGFRGFHGSRYRIIWRLLTLDDGEIAAEVVYAGIRAAGDQRRLRRTPKTLQYARPLTYGPTNYRQFRAPQQIMLETSAAWLVDQGLVRPGIAHMPMRLSLSTTRLAVPQKPDPPSGH